MKYLKDISFLIIGVVIIIGSFYLFLQRPALAKYQGLSLIQIGDSIVLVEIANTPEARTQGLSGREAIRDNTGMFFVFETPAQYGFWMKDMRFAIDIIWIDETLHVIGIEREVSPETFPQIFKPVRLAKYVLELPAEFSEKHHIDIGHVVLLDTQSTQ